MIIKTENCLYCGEKMESITAKKKFCSALHRVYWNREKEKGTLGLEIVIKDNKPEFVKYERESVLPMKKEIVPRETIDNSDYESEFWKNRSDADVKKENMQIRKVDPISDKESAAIYNATHSDSQVSIETISIKEFNLEIEKQIAAVKSEIKPDGMSVKVWLFDQNKKLKNLYSQLK